MIFGSPSKETICKFMGVPEGKEREKGMKSLFKKIMAKNFPNLGRDLDIKFMK